MAVRGVAGAAAAAATTEATPVNPLADAAYTLKVKAQMQQGDYHSFPQSVDGFGADATATRMTGGDGIVRTKLELPGGWRGKDGKFEWILEPDNKTVNHRLFVPNPQ